MSVKNNIFVVGIFGKINTGKSSLVNWLFGARFGVAAKRMTDGSWGSYVVIEDQHFLIIDVEGLFSTMRTEEEEILLLSFVTAISDVTIFNTNCAIEKSYTKLFSNLD